MNSIEKGVYHNTGSNKKKKERDFIKNIEEKNVLGDNGLTLEEVQREEESAKDINDAIDDAGRISYAGRKKESRIFVDEMGASNDTIKDAILEKRYKK